MLKRSILICLLSFFSAHADNRATLEPVVDFLVSLADQHRQNSLAPVPLFAIGGCPGVGKSYLSRTLLGYLQEKEVRCGLLSLDDFVLSPEEFKKLGVESDPNHRWFKRDHLHACLAKIFSNERLIEKPTRNQFTFEVGSEVLDLRECDLVLFDGLYALCSRPPLHFFHYAHSGLFMEANPEDIYAWKWEREQKRITPRSPEKFAKSMEIVFADFNTHIAYSKEQAKFVIKKDREHNCFLLKKD